jgi:5-methyltetrahydropteroyltriglutamate--homocysteine methyltransferase
MFQANEHYESDETYLFAIAEAMHEEYQAIVDAGLILQD